MTDFKIQDGNFILCGFNLIIKDSTLNVAMCVIDTKQEKIFVDEFIDNDFFSNIHTILIQLAPEHEDMNYYVIANFPHEFYSQKFTKLIKDIELVDKYEILLGTLKNSNYDYLSTIKYIVKDENEYILKQNMYVLAIDTLSEIVKYKKLINNEEFLNRYSIEKFKGDQYMSLDMNTLKNLNLIDNLDNKKSIHIQKLNKVKNQNINTKTSVYGILNACMTKFGSRLLKSWLFQPLMCKDTIEDRLKLVELFLSNLSYRNEIRKYLSKIDDIQTVNMNLCNKSKSKNIKLVDLAKILSAVRVCKDILVYLKFYEGVNQDILYQKYISRLEPIMEQLSRLEEMLSTTIIFDNKTREYIINYDLNKELKETYSKITDSWNIIESEKEAASSLIGGQKVSIEEYLTHGYVLKVKKSEGEKILNKNKSYKLISSLKTGIVMTNQNLIELSNQIKNFKKQYKELELICLNKVIEVSSTYYPLLESLIYILSEIDVVSSFAHVIEISNQIYCKPIISNKKKLILKDSRHLILEWNDDIIVKNNPNNKNLISNDCILDVHSNIQLITGINMGGKSTYLRQVGICVLLAHIGFYIPATYAEIPIIDTILTRVGAGDNMLKGVSTYMNEMLEICSMIKSASNNSLLLIDELGRGTSTDDGIGISYGILHHISKEINSFCLFATHFYELTEMENIYENIKNYYVSYSVSDDGNILMEYKIIPGNCSKSFGVNLFKSMKFDELTCNTLKKYI